MLLHLFIYFQHHYRNSLVNKIFILCTLFHFTLTYPCTVQKMLFLGQIFEMVIFMDLQILRSFESENHIFSAWSVCMCFCVCYPYSSKANDARNSKFSILHVYYIQMLLKTFYEDQTNNPYTGAYQRIIKHYGLWTEFLARTF